MANIFMMNNSQHVSGLKAEGADEESFVHPSALCSLTEIFAQINKQYFSPLEKFKGSCYAYSRGINGPWPDAVSASE